MRTYRATVLSFAEKCKNILASNWKGQLHTVKADNKGSKNTVYSSQVNYLFKKGRPYIWMSEDDFHGVNTLLDERGSFAVTSPFPGPLASILKSMNKTPARVALTGDVVTLPDELAKVANEKLQATILSEQEAIREASYAVTGLLSSDSSACRSENLQDILDESEKYLVFRFIIRSCMFIDCNRGLHEVELEDFEQSKKDILSPFAARIIDGINKSEARRQALTFFCFTYFNTNARDAYMLSIDWKGFDVLARVLGPELKDGSRFYQWKEFRFTLNGDALDIETFCLELLEMEEAVLEKVKSSSGLS